MGGGGGVAKLFRGDIYIYICIYYTTEEKTNVNDQTWQCHGKIIVL